MRLLFAVTLAATLLAPRAARADMLEGRTHDFLVPTGELVPAGRMEASLHMLGWTSIGVGVNDSLELRFDGPLVPFFGVLSARVGLLPRTSRWRLVLGAGAGWSFVEILPPLLTTSVLTAWQGERLNVHASIHAIQEQDGDWGVGVVNAGAVLALGPRHAVYLDVARLSLLDRVEPSFGVGYVLAAGLKFATWEGDVEVLALTPLDGDVAWVAPLVTFTRRFR